MTSQYLCHKIHKYYSSTLTICLVERRTDVISYTPLCKLQVLILVQPCQHAPYVWCLVVDSAHPTSNERGHQSHFDQLIILQSKRV